MSEHKVANGSQLRLLRSSPTRLVAKGLSKSYGTHRVLKDVSLEAEVGKSVGLFGPNGAGKTTCFRILAGALAADSGSISLDGKPITHVPLYRRARFGLGYLPQHSSVFRSLTVRQNILAALEIVESRAKARQEKLERLLEEFGLSRLRDVPASAISGGERRRTEIARALAGEPRFLLFDEPLAGIDPITISEIREMIKDLKNRGIGVLITDHNVREALEMVDSAAILYGGEVLAYGSPQELVEDESARKLYLGAGFQM
ncbi:MAG: LPS export ABC transporter ATP-binding protein [Alphaproteobacteria bacterium]